MVDSTMADPIVTASLYCSRHIDRALHEAINPFRAALQEKLGAGAYLWFYRYAKRGEHLKLRVHAPSADADALRALLDEHVQRFLAVVADEPPVERISKGAMPAMDVEDELETDQPDRSLLWTTYQRTPVIVGDLRYVQDDRHMALFTQGLAASSDYALAEVIPAFAERSYHQKRQNAFLKLAIAGMSMTDLAAPQWVTYFRYHRDWLIRHLVMISPPEVTAEVLTEELDQRLEGVRRILPSLANIMAAHREEDDDSDENAPDSASATEESSAEQTPPEPTPFDTWRTATAAFFEHVSGYRGRAEYDCDPYSEDYAFLPMFKLLHACANQLGFRISHEAYLHHLLLQAATLSAESSGDTSAGS
ncbi:hypothetical protein Hoch_1492 [Haliangium ochraceum DSM 14365]|uniref:Thiopeptide-type bacteriocin biosynthesis domain-containing protein n=2 Tax=Haliangium ochraceum TaxID=80816 RepID=D0LVR0_HALO1|nr:hypothetical protein Hoch_1492 [Haliangium ochraceum DSM 14365]